MSEFEPERQPDSQNPYSPGQPSHSELGWSSRLDLTRNRFDSDQRSPLESLPQHGLDLPAGGYYTQDNDTQLGPGYGHDGLQTANSSNDAPLLQVNDTQLGPGYGHDDLKTADSLNVYMSVSGTPATFNYDHVHAGYSLHPYDGYSNAQGNDNFGFQPSHQPFMYDSNVNLSVVDSDGPGYNQGGSILESELPYESSSTGTNFHAHGDYPSAGSRQGLHTELLPHTLPDAVAVHHAGPVYNSTASHIMDHPHLPPDAYNSSSMVSHGSNNLNLQAPISDSYYFMRSHGVSNNFQPTSDPIPEVTKKLGRIRPNNRKTKRPNGPNHTKFIGSKYTAQESSLSMAQAPSSSQPIFISPEFLRDMKDNARLTMMKALFQQNLFPSTKETSDIATQALDDTITRHCAMKGVDRDNLIQWRLGPDGKNLLARMKAAVKEIHSDFEQVAAVSWISVYGLSHNISTTKADMQATRVARLTTLLSNYLFADKIITMAMNDGQIMSYRTPFGSPAILDLLEQIICTMQYSRYISLDTDDWEPRLTNAIALAATSRAWSLEKGLAGPWSSGGVEFESDANRTRYNNMKSRLPTLSQDEASRFHELLVDMRDALR